MNIYDLQRSPEMQAAYRKWVNDPMTKSVQELLMQEGRPRQMPFEAIRGEVALTTQGESVGWFACCDRMITLDTPVMPLAEEPESTFADPFAPKNMKEPPKQQEE